MALPTNPTSNAGVTNKVVAVAGTSGYTGTVIYGAGATRYLISNPATDYVNANSGVAGASNLNYSTAKKKSSTGLPKLSGLDKALGVLGAGVAAYQTLAGLGGALDAAVGNLTTAASQLGSAFKNIGKTAAKPKPQEPGQYTKTETSKIDWRVRLETNFEILQSPILLPLVGTGGMVFPYLPNITMTHKANYTAVDPIHNNFTIQGYKNSTVEDISISGEFSVASQEEGEYWIAATTFLKTVTKMFYGQSRPQGHPPLICRLNGYGDYVFNDIPVIVKSYQVDFKDAVQYKKIMINSTATWVPVVSTITVVVSPVYSRERIRQFSLQDYAKGLESGVL